MKKPSLTEREYFTTYDIAKLLELAPRTICQLIDYGHLRASLMPKNTPRGGNRRVHRDDLLKYLEAEGYRKAAQLITPPRDANHKVLFLGCFQEYFMKQIEISLPKDWQVFCCLHPIQAGAIWQGHHPQVVVIDFSIGNWLAHTTAQWLSWQREKPYLLGVLPEEGLDWGREVGEYGWNIIHQYTKDAVSIAGIIVQESEAILGKGEPENGNTNKNY